MILVRYLTQYPDIRLALLGNLRRKRGVQKFIPMITALNNPGIEAMIANLEPETLMKIIKSMCKPEEKKLIDDNPDWFKELSEEMNILLEEEEDSRDAEEEIEDVISEAVGGTKSAPDGDRQEVSEGEEGTEEEEVSEESEKS